MEQIYSKSKANFLLGSLLNNPQLIYRKEYQLSKDDFQYLPHRILFVAINMLANEGVSNITPKEIGELLENYPSQLNVLKDELDDWVGFVDTIKELSSEDSFDFYYNSIRKYTLIRKYRDNGFDISKFWDFEKTDEINNAELDKYEIKDIIKHYDNTNADIKSEFSNSIDGSEVIIAGSGFNDFLDEMEQTPLLGSSFLSEYLNGLTRGQVKGQLSIFASPSGCGKTTVAISNIVNLCATKIWSDEVGDYIDNPYQTMNGGLYIEYEMELVSEVTSKFISSISGIPCNVIFDGFYDKKIRERLDKANEILQESNIHLVYMPTYTCQSIEDTIKEHKNKYNIDIVCFDYISDCPELNAELTRQNGGVSLRNDQILLTLSSRLKDYARRYDVVMYSMVQTNGNIGTSEIIGAECFAGARALVNKTDIAGVLMPLRPKEEKLTEEIMTRQKGFHKAPNYIFHMVKMRFSKYPMSTKVWCHIDLGTGKITDCFCTDCMNKPINVEPLKLIQKTIDNN